MSKGVAISIVGCFVLGVLGWALEAAHYQAYLDLRSLLRTSMLMTLLSWGVLLGLGRSWWYRLELETWQRLQRAFILGLAVLVLVPPLVSATNRWGTASQAVLTTVTFEQESARYQSRFGNAEVGGTASKPSQYLLFFYWKSRLYRIGYKAGPKFVNQEPGDTIRLPISPGRWGFYWVPTEQL